MKLKCKLESHHRIPPPVLSILVGRLPQVSTPLPHRSPNPLSPRQDDQDDSWNNDWDWEDDDEDEDDKSSDDTSVELPPVNEAYLASASPVGRYILLAHQTKFVMLALHEEEDEYYAVGQGSGCEVAGETITAVLCLPLFVPSIRRNQMCAMIGYSTGWLRVFSEKGTMLTAQLLEPAAILSIKMRTPTPVFKVSPQMMLNEDEEITLLFANKKVVSINGQTLWMVLRVCDGQRESGIDASRSQVSFSYQKWEFQGQENITDVISLGASPSDEPGPLSAASSTSTYVFQPGATSRYVGVGSNPMFSYYETSEVNRPLTSAVSMASYVVSRVATPVLSLAKSWWTGTAIGNQASSRSSKPSPYVPNMPMPPSQIEPATPIRATLSLSDAFRTIRYVSVCPPSSSDRHHKLAATSDALGRVILWSLDDGEMIRMWKGIRDAVCGWVEVFEDDLYSPNEENNTGQGSRSKLLRYERERAKILLFLVIFSPRRGLLKVIQMRHGHQIGVFHIGSGWNLVSCGREPLGSSMVSIERRRMAMKNGEDECGALSKCFLIGPKGEVCNINIYLNH
ncbi:Rab3 GTPase-activating protein regulatory subunit N-terminus-domain-containing protein [Radiomyces spectabilis]|uniref:Rab3 GTPase-activating protein regulatory subunit N-terminus-domain-containing protein n=1 Tax=Radiomyces spectabilis TaxID=64574 RepID=UPI00221F701B|nr:Rab3 GTPase-activating protein regulatory subunit N-terminus-domain-containing protein [Radiomyces spectabilis]KAI8384443.1 Rab3 GTPase-activating protein regulatory subunit N-terminus-domain-containing protein [Radiomyces spectabilis]